MMEYIDALDEAVSLDDIEHEVNAMNRAGLDDLTPVDKFMELNGTVTFITEV